MSATSTDAAAPLVRAHAIPIGARILCVCASYNALITNRPYRAALTPEAAMEELRRCCNTQFDPRVVEALERVLDADGAALAVAS